MNFVAHSVVAVRSGMDEAGQILGAVLGDLSAMARIRFDVGRLPPAVADGVRLHWAADRAFHADRVFLAGADALRTSASSVGVARGASRAIGHAGWELLLDGRLAADSDAALVAALEIAPSLSAACATDRDAGSWGRLAARIDRGSMVAPLRGPGVRRRAVVRHAQPATPAGLRALPDAGGRRGACQRPAIGGHRGRSGARPSGCPSARWKATDRPVRTQLRTAAYVHELVGRWRRDRAINDLRYRPTLLHTSP